MRLPITTDRLIIRKMELRDLSSLLRNMNDPEVVEEMDLIPAPFTRAHGEDWINGCIKQYRLSNPKYYVLAIADKKSGRMIGEVGLNELKLPKREGEIMYWLDRQYHGKGLMFGEVLPPFIKFAFDKFGLAKMTAGIYSSNKPSINAAERLGFQYEKSRRVVHRGKRVTERKYVLKKES